MQPPELKVNEVSLNDDDVFVVDDDLVDVTNHSVIAPSGRHRSIVGGYAVINDRAGPREGVRRRLSNQFYDERD